RHTVGQSRTRLGRLIGRRRRADARSQGEERHTVAAATATASVITPRRTRLVRVPDLRARRRAGARPAARVPHGLFPSAAVVAPARGAARQLQRAFRGAPPEIVTRDELYDSFNARLASPPRRLAPWEREVMLHAAADDAVAAGAEPPFEVRPGLIAEMV